MEDAEKELTEAEAGVRNFRQWKAWPEEPTEAIQGEAPDLHLRLRAHLRERIAIVEVFTTGYTKQYDPDTVPLDGPCDTPAADTEAFAE